jgi:arylsulfatase A-like enzyme
VYYDYGSDLGTTPIPDEVTNAAIHEYRNTRSSRMVVHYMQPHEPYIQNEQNGDLPETHSNPFDELQAGKTTSEETYSAYLDNLRKALDSVSRLLRNIDAERVVVSADHGELFGEWGVYAHPAAFPHPAVRKVPWVITGANNTANEDITPPKQVEVSTEKRLSDLGYI